MKALQGESCATNNKQVISAFEGCTRDNKVPAVQETTGLRFIQTQRDVGLGCRMQMLN